MSTKKCSSCQEILPFSEFNKGNSKNGLASICKKCIGDFLKKRHKNNVEFISEIKGSVSCAECGFSNPAALDFHHLSRETKKDSISNLKSRKRETIITEIEKCVVLCANCHRILHNSGSDSINNAKAWIDLLRKTIQIRNFRPAEKLIIEEHLGALRKHLDAIKDKKPSEFQVGSPSQ